MAVRSVYGNSSAKEEGTEHYPTICKRNLLELAGLVAFGVANRAHRWCFSAPRNWIYSLVLRSPRSRVGSDFRFFGRQYVQVGERFHALDQLWIEAVFDGIGRTPVLEIGANVTCSNAVHIAARNRLSIGSGVLIGSHVLITDHNHGVYRGYEQSDPRIPPALRDVSRGGEVFIGDNVWIGDQVVVLPGARIGRGSVIGSQTVVRGEVPENSIAAGNPMRILRTFNRESGTWKAVSDD